MNTSKRKETMSMEKIIKGKRCSTLHCKGGNYGRRLSYEKYFELEKQKLLKGGDFCVESWFDLDFLNNDGGREKAGYKGTTGDCVTRSISIASGLPYQKVYNDLYTLTTNWRLNSNSKHSKIAKPKDDSPRNGVYKDVYDSYIKSLGFKWIPTMKIGQGCKVHLRKNELPQGKLIVRVSKHITSVIDGVINDTYNCSRNGTRCVYGYYIKENQ